MWEGFYLEDPCELTFANTLLLSNAAISLGNAFINLEISSEYIIFFTLWSFFLSSLFISLQIKEFRILALSINDSLYSSLFFFLTGLHFFHLSIGLILLIYFWSSRSFTFPRPPTSRRDRPEAGWTERKVIRTAKELREGPIFSRFTCLLRVFVHRLCSALPSALSHVFHSLGSSVPHSFTP